MSKKGKIVNKAFLPRLFIEVFPAQDHADACYDSCKDSYEEEIEGYTLVARHQLEGSHASTEHH